MSAPDIDDIYRLLTDLYKELEKLSEEDRSVCTYSDFIDMLFDSTCDLFEDLLSQITILGWYV
jgi:hypothetical protein